MTMQAKAGGKGCGGELKVELKYCERCGGLCLRPAGGGQVYCAPCARAMAELPQGYARDRSGSGYGNEIEVEEDDDEFNLDISGGVA